MFFVLGFARSAVQDLPARSHFGSQTLPPQTEEGPGHRLDTVDVDFFLFLVVFGALAPLSVLVRCLGS